MNLPADFTSDMTSYLGEETYGLLVQALQAAPPVSIRFNPLKASSSDIAGIIKEHDATRVPWCDLGYYLSQRPQFTFDPLLHAGCYYVQEASSMFLWHILSEHLRQRKDAGLDAPITALDLCAAPGGKSTLALSLLPAGSILIANEAIRQRSNILAENIIKWGCPNCIVTNNYAEDFSSFTHTFDVIICDAPCSGEGMFRKDPKSIDEWSAEGVAACCKTQRDIVSNIWHALKPGGLLIYSTCTYNAHEDEENAEWMARNLGADIISCHPKEEWNLADTNTHFFPHIVKGEGFFVSVLKKHGEEDDTTPREAKRGKKSKISKQAQKNKMPKELQQWIASNGDYTINEANGTYRAFPTVHKDLLLLAEKNLRVVHSGIELGKAKGKSVQPSQSLAMSASLNRGIFPEVELPLQQAIAYLRTEALSLPCGTPTGYVLLTYHGHPLGFAKNIGSRANNLYPSEWKIRSGYGPKEP